jgi:hypothetical protein
LWYAVFKEGDMSPFGHGGARPGAGRKPNPEPRIKRAVRLTPAADAVVVAHMQPGDTYSATLERILLARSVRAARRTVRTQVEQLMAVVRPERQPVAVIYRQLGWSRQTFERCIQRERDALATHGVQLHVATKDAASGRRERYITVDGVRYSALSRDP